MKPAYLAHISTVHRREDVRIFVKQARSLASIWVDQVVLIVADGKGDEISDGVKIIDLGKLPKARLFRFFVGSYRVFKAVVSLNLKVCHFHDPELIPVFILLRTSERSVIYDVHEDVSQQILTKHWIPSFFRSTVSKIFMAVQYYCTRRFSAIVACTPAIVKTFPNNKVVLVRNFPKISEFSNLSENTSRRENRFIYLGGILPERGAVEMVSAVAMLDHVSSPLLDLAGVFAPAQLRLELEEMPGWKLVKFHGYVDRIRVADLLQSACAGLVALHPKKSYIDSYPVKLFEYMAAGLPVIASDFPIWREIVSTADCGLLVDPLDPAAIARAMSWIIEHPEEASRMGERGRQEVIKKYNWDEEFNILGQLYEDLLAHQAGGNHI